MKPFATALLLTLAAATQASALTMNLPVLTFPPTTTTISAQNAAQPGK